MDDDDIRFTDSIAELYDRHLVPLIFEPYADDLATDTLGEARSAASVTIAYCGGTRLRTEIEARLEPDLEAATRHVASVIAERFGPHRVVGRMRAFVITTR